MAEADLNNETKFPIFLPKESWLTKLIILDLHKTNKHCGIQTLLALVRQKYWLLKGRKEVERVIFSTKYGCLACRKYRLKPYNLRKFDTLPKYRVSMSRPFTTTGIDYFGPMKIKGLNNSVEKAYGALFTCMSVRAIHLELAEDLSAESFLRAYRRFASRRGVPSLIVSDNATNFTLGSKFVKDLNSEMKFQGTDWQFTTPRNPREGGAWERMVGITKMSIRRCIGRNLLQKDELQTLLCEVEAIVNSRPLTFMSEREPHRALRPIDFLIQIEDPPESNKIMAGAYNWLLTLTDLINKVLTKRRFDFFTASPPLLLVEADTIIVSENTVQSARAWSNEKSVRLITIDGSRELHEIIFTGRFVREIIYIVQADDQISAGIESTLRFFAENSLKFKTTLVLHEPEKYTDRLRMVEQFRNMAETYSTGFYTMRGRPGELAEIRHKINATPRFTTTESEELLDADVPSTSGFNTTEIEKIREKFKPTSTMVAEPIIINEKLAAHYRERNKSPPASYYKERAKEEERIRDLARTKWPQGKYVILVIAILAIMLPTVVATINKGSLNDIQNKEVQNITPEFKRTHTTITKKGRRILVALSPERKAYLKELQKRQKPTITETNSKTHTQREQMKQKSIQTIPWPPTNTTHRNHRRAHGPDEL
nr:unnamed protein product [Meloidogyne enterolobii]